MCYLEMINLSEYHSDKDRIKELELELELAKKNLLREIKLKSKWKCKYLSITSKGIKASLLIKKLKPTGKQIRHKHLEIIKAIAEKCLLSETYVYNLWYKCS